MKKRVLGKTNLELSIIGVGGLVFSKITAEDAARVAAQAVERGVNYFDVGPAYGDAEERLGPALEPFRNNVFLASKTNKRGAEEARQELERSLRRLRTDRLDLYQLHSVRSMEQVEQIMSPDGAIHVLTEAREKGRVRYLGFSAHSDDIACALMDRFDFDTMLFPINWACWFASEHGKTALEEARRRNMGAFAIKALARRRLEEGEPKPRPKAWYYPIQDREVAALALRFTLSQKVTAAVSPGNEEQLWWMCDAAEDPAPLSPDEEAQLRSRMEGDPIFPK